CDLFSLFLFEAEDGIRDSSVTGVQTCALPISRMLPDAVTQQLGWNPALAPPPIDPTAASAPSPDWLHPAVLQGLGIAPAGPPAQIGRASWRERGESSEVE